MHLRTPARANATTPARLHANTPARNGVILATSPHVRKNAIRRRWQLEHHGIRRVGSKETGFRYESADGRPVEDERTLARIAKLRVPPAWAEVRIARGDGAPLQAIGYDRKGRLQYRYHPKFRAQREEEKFQRVVEFGEALPRLRRRVRADLARNDLGRERVLASIVRIIDQGFFRVGNKKSALMEETYGLTTVTKDHVSVRKDEVHFDFVGKWRKPHRRAVADGDVANVVRQLRRMSEGELFKYVNGSGVHDVHDRDVNDYIQSAIGDGFTAKDFRTWAGTLLCSISLGLLGQAHTKKERKRRIKKAIEATSLQLGNTPAVCRASYICPRLLDEYMEGKPFELARKRTTGTPFSKTALSAEERALLRFLRETIADRRRAPRAA